jgi:hypothetical protein
MCYKLIQRYTIGALIWVPLVCHFLHFDPLQTAAIAYPLGIRWVSVGPKPRVTRPGGTKLPGSRPHSMCLPRARERQEGELTAPSVCVIQSAQWAPSVCVIQSAQWAPSV